MLVALYKLKDGERFCQNLCRHVDVSHSHIKSTLALLEENGFIKIEKG